MKIDRVRSCAIILLLSGLALRAVGWDRGASDFVLPEHKAEDQAQAFYAFHPDEISLLNAALRDIDLLNPPYTSYGTLPPYLLGTTLRLLDLHKGRQSLTDAPAQFRRDVYHTARVVSVLFSLGVLVFAGLIAHRLYGPWPALGAVAITAFAPGAIQQSHYFITDGPFAMLSLAGLWAILRTAESHEGWRRFLLAGLLIGLSACVRFNGGLLGILLATVLVLRHKGPIGSRLAHVFADRRLWATAAIALGLLLVLHPYVVVNPELLTRARFVGDIALAMQFASGHFLQPWTLVDVDVIPYASHWFGSWPLIVGWPLTIGFAGALGWALWRGDWQQRLLAVWCLLYFLPVGLLPARAVRHLVPLLAPLAILAVGAAMDLYRVTDGARPRRILAAASGLMAIHLFLYGTAFARIYLEEDSRIRAGRFLASKVRPGATIAVESGAFRVADLVSSRRYRYLWMDMSMLLYAGPYMLCGDRVDYLQNKMDRIGAMVYVEENRSVQYAAVPELFPVTASFYEQLAQGSFGFDVVRRFKTYPEVAGIRFSAEGQDPTFSGYDHPTVNVLLRRDDADIPAAFDRWRLSLTSSAFCPDNTLHAASARLAAGDHQGALSKIRQATRNNPNALISYRLEAEVLKQLGDESGAREAMRHYLPESAGGRMAHVINPNMVHFVTASTAASFVRLGLYDLALAELQEGLQETYDTSRALTSRAWSYLRVASAFASAGYADHREAAVRMSLSVFKTSDGLNALSHIVARRGELLASRQLLEQSLLLNARQSDVHFAVAELFLATDPDYDRALIHLDQAVSQDEKLSAKVQVLRDRILAARGTSDSIK